jgi:hypothetical protein
MAAGLRRRLVFFSRLPNELVVKLELGSRVPRDCHCFGLASSAQTELAPHGAGPSSPPTLHRICR